jgi:hypothetical protein
MPVRDKAIDRVLRTVLDGTPMSFNNLDWTAQVGDEIMTRDEFNQRFWDPIDRAYEAVVDSIDWNRVLLEATGRHIALKHPDEDYTGMLCAECLCESLLADATFVSWKQEPKVTRIKDRDSEGEDDDA